MRSDVQCMTFWKSVYQWTAMATATLGRVCTEWVSRCGIVAESVVEMAAPALTWNDGRCDPWDHSYSASVLSAETATRLRAEWCARAACVLDKVMRKGYVQTSDIETEEDGSAYLEAVEQDPMGQIFACATCVRAFIGRPSPPVGASVNGAALYATPLECLLTTVAACMLVVHMKCDGEQSDLSRLQLYITCQLCTSHAQRQHIRHNASTFMDAVSDQIVAIAVGQSVYRLVECNLRSRVEWRIEGLRCAGDLRDTEALRIIGCMQFFCRLAAENTKHDVLASAYTAAGGEEQLADALVLIGQCALFYATRRTAPMARPSQGVCYAAVTLVENARARAGQPWPVAPSRYCDKHDVIGAMLTDTCLAAVLRSLTSSARCR